MDVEIIKMSLYHDTLNGLIPGPDGKGTIIISLVEWLRSQGIFTGGVSIASTILIKVVAPPNYQSKWVATISIDEDLNIDIWGPEVDVQTHLSNPESFDIIKEAVCKWRSIRHFGLKKIWTMPHEHAANWKPYWTEILKLTKEEKI